MRGRRADEACLAESLKTVRLPDTPSGKEAVRALERDLEGYLRMEEALDLPLAPRDFEVRFGTVSSAPGLKEGLRLDGYAVSGTIDRIDRDPAMSARGVIWDYKSGREVHSAADIENDWRLQIPLYILAVRELVGVEPVAGLYRALAGERLARGMAVAGEVDTRYPQRPAGGGRVLGAGRAGRPAGERDRAPRCGQATSATIPPGARARTGAGAATPGSAGCRR